MDAPFDFSAPADSSAASRAGPSAGTPKLSEAEIVGLKYFDQLLPLLKRLHVDGCSRDRARNREKLEDYAAFQRILAEGLAAYDVKLLCFVLMPNHWHLILQPHVDGELSRFMRWITATHTMRYRAHYHTAGEGHVYQGRFKSFPIQDDAHFLTVCRYVERNAARARLVKRAEEWHWSSLWRWMRPTEPDPPLLEVADLSFLELDRPGERTAHREGAGRHPQAGPEGKPTRDAHLGRADRNPPRSGFDAQAARSPTRPLS